MTTKLTILETVRVASPCSVKWADMVGDERVRVCAQCTKKVFNLSALTLAEAEALIVERAGNLCVRYYERADGTILTADCPVGVRAKRRRRWIAAAIGMASSIGASIGIGAAIGIFKTPRPADHDDVVEAIPQVPVVQPSPLAVKRPVPHPPLRETAGVPPPPPAMYPPPTQSGRVRRPK